MIRAAITIALICLGLSACSSSDSGAAAAPTDTSPIATAAVTPVTTSASSLTDSWIPRLESLALDSCRSNQFSADCFSAVMQLQTATMELGTEADKRGNSIVKAEAVKVAADLQRYTDECVTSKPMTPERSKCLSLIVQLPNTHEGLVAAIHESEPK